MSDQIIRIITTNPYEIVSKESLEKAKSYLMENITCEKISIIINEHPEFKDCGENLQQILCPECNSKISFEKCFELMYYAYENNFSDLMVEVPCCGKKVSLNDLEYISACGFSTCAIKILNPHNLIDEELVKKIAEILNTDVRLISAYL